MRVAEALQPRNGGEAHFVNVPGMIFGMPWGTIIHPKSCNIWGENQASSLVCSLTFCKRGAGTGCPTPSNPANRFFTTAPNPPRVGA